MMILSARRLQWILCLTLSLSSAELATAQDRAPRPLASRPVRRGPVAFNARSIDDAISRGKQWIYSQQHAGGHWEKEGAREGSDHADYARMQGDTFGGYTALATYALLAAGESPNDPRIKAAVEFLKSCDMVGMYALAMRCQVWLLIPHQSAEMKELIRKDAQALFEGMNDGSLNPKNKGMWDYLGKGPRLDHSVSQYGVLGLWACQQTGVIDVGTSRWKTMETTWRSQQYADGGWDYGPIQDQTPSMTAAGVASLFIIDDYLHAEEGIGCTGNPINPWIDKGLAWIDNHYSQIGPNAYAMYGIERIGAASGYRFFARRDWFNDLGKTLVNSQGEDGSFVVMSYPGGQQLDATCFAVLFLARGRAPVMMNKLDYHAPGEGAATQMMSAAAGSQPAGAQTQPATAPALTAWNQRPRDLANLSAWTARQLETYLQWQIVNLDVAPEDLHDAPVLYLSGSEGLKITPDHADKLRRFIEQGGMVVGNADCAHGEFSRSFEALGQELFGRPFRPLPAEHPIFTHEQFPASRWSRRPTLRGLSNGVRELMLLIPDDDPARWWQAPRAQTSHAESYELGTDIYQYSNDRQIWNKGESYMVRPDPTATASRAIKVARLQVGDNWDPEPGGWRRLAVIAHNQDQIDLQVVPTRLGDGTLAAAQVAHLTGTTAFTLNAAAKLELKSFVQNGGTLVIDTAGGAPEFVDAAQAQLKDLFGEAATTGLARPLPPDHAVYKMPEHRIDTFTYRAWTRVHGVGNLKQPRLRGIEIGNRVAVFFSREDLSAGLVGEPVDGIVGYSPETATDIMRNILLYCARPGTRTSATVPASQGR